MYDKASLPLIHVQKYFWDATRKAAQTVFLRTKITSIIAIISKLKANRHLLSTTSETGFFTKAERDGGGQLRVKNKHNSDSSSECLLCTAERSPVRGTDRTHLHVRTVLLLGREEAPAFSPLPGHGVAVPGLVQVFLQRDEAGNEGPARCSPARWAGRAACPSPFPHIKPLQ